MMMFLASDAPSRPALRYHGGKWKLAPWIIGHLPAHTCYVEPFGGAMSVLLRKAPSLIEIYNDVDERVVNFFRVLRERPDELVGAIELTPYARAELRASGEPSDDPLEAARRWYVRCQQGFGSPTRKSATGLRYQRDLTKRTDSAVDNWNTIDHLHDVAARLKGVLIEADPAEAVIRRYDASETLFYVDPPYVRSLRNREHNDYAQELTDRQHADLALLLNSIQGMAVVSGYDCPLYREIFGCWEMVSRETIDTAWRRRVECLWLSPRAAARVPQMRMELLDA